MKSNWMAVAVVVGLLIGGGVLGVWRGTAFGQRQFPETGCELITHLVPAGDRAQQLTVIDPRARVLSVYHIDSASGAVTLKSVRNVHWDLQMMEFNGVSPLPREIRAQLDPR